MCLVFTVVNAVVKKMPRGFAMIRMINCVDCNQRVAVRKDLMQTTKCPSCGSVAATGSGNRRAKSNTKPSLPATLHIALTINRIVLFLTVVFWAVATLGSFAKWLDDNQRIKEAASLLGPGQYIYRTTPEVSNSAIFQKIIVQAMFMVPLLFFDFAILSQLKNRRNWLRWTVAILFLCGIIPVLVVLSNFSCITYGSSAFWAIATGFATLLFLVARLTVIVLLLVPMTSHWFKVPIKNRLARA